MPKSIGRKGIIAIVLALIAVIGVASLAFFTDRVDHSMQFTTASFSADGYKLTRTAPEGPFCAGEEVTATLKESNTGDDDVNSIISMKATWVSPDTSLSIFGNASAADNATLSIGGTKVDYTVNAGNKSISFDLPKQVLAAGANNKTRDLTLTIPASFKSTGRIEFTFEKVVVAQEGGGFSKEYSRTDLNAAGDLDYSVKVGWAASSIAAQNGKALMGYLTDKNASGKFGIEFEFAYNYNTSPMKDFASKTDAKWSYYKDKADRLTFVEGMTTIGDYAFPDFELVTSLKLPESLVSVGKWSFDNISISALKLPAALTNFDTMSFGHINELTAITFEQAANTNLSFPTAGSSTGAFFVAPYAEPTNRTKINGTNTDALAYDWVADQRKLVPVLQSWDPEANTDFHGLRDKVSGISFTNSYALPDGFDTAAGYGPWDVSAAKDGSVMAYMTPKTGADIASGYYFIYAASLPDGITGTVVKGNGSVTWDATAGKYTWSADKVAATGKTVSEWIAGGYTGTNYFVPDNDPTTYYSIANSDGENSQLTKYVRAGGYNVVIASNTGWTEDVIANADSDYICNNMLGLTTFSDDHLDTSNVKSFRQTFNNCSSLTDCDLSGVDSSNVKNFYGMFNGCSNLTTLNATFDTSGVNDATLNKTADPLMALSSDEKENGISGGLAHLFDGCEKLTAVDTSAWELSGAQSLHSTFSDCKALTGLEVGNWNVSGVQSFECTFNNCYNIAALDVSRWQVGNAETMERMFNSCGSLTTLAVDNWDVSKVKDFGCMFVNCNQLKTLNVSKWNTSSAETMSSMFWCCESLQALDVSKWDVSKVKSFYFAFADCPLITKLAVGNWNTSSVQTFYYMFAGCEKLTTIDVATKKVNAGTANEYTAWDTSHADTFDYMFGYCYSLTNLDVSDWVVTGSGTCADGSAKRSLSTFRMFAGTKIEKITLGAGWDELDTTLYGMLYLTDITFEHTASDALALTSTPGSRDGIGYVGTSSIITSSPFNADNLLKTNIHVSNKTIKDIVFAYDWTSDFRKAVPDVPTLAAGSGWYKGTTAKSTITEIELVDTYTATGNEAESWDASAAQDGSVMAYVNGTKLIIAGNGYGKVLANADSTSAFNAFTNVTSFTGLNKLDTSNVTNMQTMFNNLDNIQTLDLSSFNTSKVTNFYSIFGGNDKLTTLNLTGWDTSAAKDMGQMFYVCNALTTINGLSSFNTANVTDMSGMFHGCKAMTSLDLSNFNTAEVKTLSMMFYQCSNLETVKLTSFDTSAVTNMSAAFDGCHKLQEITLGKAFKFVGTDGYLPTPSSTYITGADGKWYDTNTGTGYTPEALASVERTKAVTYSAVKLERIGGLDVGESVFLNVDGKRMEFIVVNQGNPDTSIYDDSCNGTWLLMKDIYEKRQWHSADVNNLENSTIHSYLNSTFLNLFDSNIQKAIKQVKLPYRKNGGSGGTDQSGANGLSCKVFLLSGYEVGWTTSDEQYFSVDGAKLAYFESGTGTSANNKRIANFGGSAAYWWLRSPDNTTTFNLWCVQPGGSKSVSNARGSFGIRPALVLPSTVTVDNDRNVGGSTGGGGGDIPADLNLAVPKQSGTLTYTGSAQSPSWSNYDASKMTMGGTTTGTNAGSYTTTFALNDGFKWADGTTGTKSVIWKIGKTTGSVSFSKDSLSIDKNSTTDTLDVTRTGTGAITAKSSDTSVATVTVNGTKVTVTKVGDGTATITIKVAADANYKEASKTCSVTCVGIPTLAYGSTWYKGSTDKASITKIQIKDSYTPSGTAAESWNADARNSGSIKAYVEGTTLTIAGNGTGKIKANALSWSVFNGFSSATAITGLDLMDTSNALTMEAMFYGCKALTALDVSKFDTSNVTSMRAMFYECENLTSLNVSKFDTASVTNVEAMFQGCKALTAVGDVSGWNTAKVTSMYQVFYGCEKLAALDLSGWNTINVTNMQAMFLDCTSLTSVGDLSGWNTAKVTEMALLFGNCEKLASLDVSKFNTAAVTNMNAMFGNCSALTTLDVSKFNTAAVTNMNAMFFNCSALTTLDVSGFDTAKTTNLAAMFSGCVSLTSLDVSNWNTSNVTTMEATFQSCKKLTTMGEVSGWDTSKVTNMREMFCQCNLITSVDVTNWKTGNVTNMNGIFSNCEKLTSVGDLSGWDTSSATDMGMIFNSCIKLTGMGDISQWDTSNATKMNCLFATCESLTELDLSGWDTSKVTDMNNIFGGYEHEQLEEGEIAGECVLLRKITLGAKFKFVGTDSYLPEPDSRYISGADGKWYVGSTGYTPAELAGLNRTEAVTYVAVKGTKTMSILSGDNAVSGYSISE